MEAMLLRPAEALRPFPVWLLLGPRQVGKSSVLLRCARDRRYVNLDDLATRMRANEDPILFARDLQPPLLIDEIQYAPALLPAIKIIADSHPGPGAVWMTGSQSFEVMRGVEETLAGRVAILELHGLSDEERVATAASPEASLQNLLRTGYPAISSASDDARELYLSSYLQTYIERDVRELLGIQKRREFERFVRLCALRTGQLVNFDDLGRDAGVSSTTAKAWLSLLEDSFLVTLIPPWHTNRAKRLLKSQKLYFLDAGLAAYLSGWRSVEQVQLGPQAGALFETQVLNGVLAAFHHRAKEARVSFWRDRDGREIDFLIETRDGVVPLEVKLGTPSRLPKLDRLREQNWKDGWVATLTQPPGAVSAVDPDWTAVSPLDIPSRVLALDANT